MLTLVASAWAASAAAVPPARPRSWPRSRRRPSASPGASPTVVKGFRKKEIATLAKRDLAAGSNVVTDGLSCRTAVSEAGCYRSHGDRLRAQGREVGALHLGQHRAR